MSAERDVAQQVKAGEDVARLVRRGGREQTDALRAAWPELAHELAKLMSAHHLQAPQGWAKHVTAEEKKLRRL